MRNKIMRAAAAALIGLVAFAGSANAVIIEGEFFLTVNQPNAQQGDVYKGTFVTADTGASGAGDSVALTAFRFEHTFTGINPNFPGSIALSFVIDSAVPTNSFAVDGNGFQGAAVLAGNGTVAFLSGDAFDGAFNLGLGGDLTTLGNGDFAIGGSPPSLALDGDQTIPEPSAIALMGAGLFAFGLARVRRSKVS